MKLITHTENEFKNFRCLWDNLLLRSDANQLFMSWAWQYNWWCIWKKRLNIKLLFIAIYTDEGELVGIASLYSRNNNVCFGVKNQTIEILGNCSASQDSIRTEYLNFIVDLNYSEQVFSKIFSYLKINFRLYSLIFSDLEIDCCLHNYIRKQFPYSYTQLDGECGYSINTKISFEEYLSIRSGSVRRRLFNKRKNLLKSSEVFLQQVANKDEFLNFIGQLNYFHKERWGIEAFSKHTIEFYLLIYAEGLVHATTILVNKKPIGLCFDVVYGGCAYNLQLVYEQEIEKVSAGWITLGFLIEEYTNNPAVLTYDLLVGQGKHQNYKCNISDAEYELVTIVVFNSLIMKFMCNIKNILKKTYHFFRLGDL